MDNINSCNDEIIKHEEMDEFDDEGNGLAVALKLIKKFNFKIGSNVTYVPPPMSFITPKSTIQLFLERTISNFDILLNTVNFNVCENSLDRIFQVHRYLTSSLSHLPIMEKSLNSILGETLNGQIHVNMGCDKIETDNYYCCEQISHHPSMFACEIHNEKEGINVLFNYIINLYFMGTYTKLEFSGKTIICLEKFNETYESNLPVYCGRFLRGFGEYSGEFILSSSNYKIVQNFIEKPLIGGNYDRILANVIELKTNQTTHKITGQWSKELKIKNLNTNQSSLYFEKPNSSSLINNIKDSSLPTDSNNVWKQVFNAHNQNNHKLKSIEIKKVEKQQKQLEHDRRLNNIEWLPKHFIKNQNTNNMWCLKTNYNK